MFISVCLWEPSAPLVSVQPTKGRLVLHLHYCYIICNVFLDLCQHLHTSQVSKTVSDSKA